MFTLLKIILLGSSSILIGESTPFIVGETLNYSASFSGVKAGRGSLKIIKEDGNSFHIQFHAKTNKLTSYFFPINDIIDIWIDKVELTPILIKENISEGSYKRKNTINFFQNKGKAIINNKDTISFNTSVHSPYSLFYFFRKFDILNYKNKTIKLFQKKNANTIKVNVENKVTLNTKLGEFTCTKVSPVRSDNKQFKNESSISIWFSEDTKKYPVQIWLKMKYGGLMLKLEEIIN